MLIITSINIEVFTEAEESQWNGIQEITSGIGFVKIPYVIQELIGEVMGRGRTVDI